MRNKFVFLLFVILIAAAAARSVPAQDFYGTTDLKVFRDGRDHEMRDPTETALRDEDRANFAGLKYFDTDKKYRLMAKVIKQPSDQKINFETSSGRVKTYLRYGVAEFKLGGRKHRLAVYLGIPGPKPDQYDDLLFVPFKDGTSGKETYGAGRYLSIWLPKRGDKVLLDFNMAYNPSCAYGTSRFSCPVPPRENRLAVEIRAGEKSYLTSH
jgi:uncharacterized protein (DUF1684 family)